MLTDMSIKAVGPMHGASETGAKPTGHMRFQRYFAGDGGVLTEIGHSAHHRHGAAHIDFAHSGQGRSKGDCDKAMDS